MSIDFGAPRTMTRLLYPRLTLRLTAADLHQIYGPTYKKREWAPTVARSPSSQVALVAQLRVFQAVGRFFTYERRASVWHSVRRAKVRC